MLVPPSGGPVYFEPTETQANIGPAGPAAQNNIPPPTERTTSFLMPAGEERRRGGEEVTHLQTGHQNVGLCSLGGSVMCGPGAVCGRR